MALLEVARPDLGLAGEFKAYTIPSDVIRALKEKKAVESKVYRASSMKTFYHHAKHLNKAEVQMVFNIVQKQLPLEDPHVQGLLPERRALVLALASEYLALLINKDMLDRDRSTVLTQALFSERIKQGLPVSCDAPPVPEGSPEQGHKARRIRLSGGRNKEMGFLSLAYRSVYHGLLDPLHGFEKGAQVEFLNIELRDYEYDGIRLENLKLIDIKSLSPINKFFKPTSWRFSLGAARREIDSEEALVKYAQADMGVTIGTGDWMVAGMAHVELDVGRNLDHGYGVASGLFLDLVYQTDLFSIDLGVLSMKYVLGDDDLVTSFWGKGSIPIGKDNAIFGELRVNPKGERRRYEIRFGVSHYF